MPKPKGTFTPRALYRSGVRALKKPLKLAAFDIETDGLGGDYLDGAGQTEDDCAPTRLTTRDACWDWLLTVGAAGYVVYAHNGGEYDYKYLLPHCMAWLDADVTRRIEPIIQGNRCIGLVLLAPAQDLRIELRDSIPLLNTSLARACESFCPELPKLSIGLDKGVTYDPNNAEHLSYLYRDVSALLLCMRRFMTMCEELFHVRPGWTCGSTAMRAWKRTIPKGHVYWRRGRHVEAFCREAYFGGWCSVTDTRRRADMVTLDVNSMYPFVMRANDMPTGCASYSDVERTDKPGFWRCHVHVPTETATPFLPYRMPEGGLCTPTGDFDGVYPSCLIAAARARGATVTVSEGYVFEFAQPLFTEFVDICEAARKQYRGQAQETVIKLVQNALYGKFGSRALVTKWVLASPANGIELNRQGYQEWLDESTGEVNLYLYGREEPLEEAYIHPEWAATITAQARLHLLAQVEATGNCAIATDTDSLTIPARAYQDALASGAITVDPAAYGALKVERDYETFQIAAPKNYRGVTRGGEVVHKAKGIPRQYLTEADHLAALDGVQVNIEYQSVVRMQDALTRASPDSTVNLAITRNRSYSTSDSVRSIVVAPDGLARPVAVGGHALAPESDTS